MNSKACLDDIDNLSRMIIKTKQQSFLQILPFRYVTYVTFCTHLEKFITVTRFDYAMASAVFREILCRFYAQQQVGLLL